MADDVLGAGVQRDFLDRALPERFGTRILPFDAKAAIEGCVGRLGAAGDKGDRPGRATST